MYEWVCKKCGSVSLHIKDSGNNCGLYCTDCGAWLKWLGKDERRAFESRVEIKSEIVEAIPSVGRKCSGYYMEQDIPDPSKGGIRYHKAEFTNGRFHQFGNAYEEFESGAGNYSTAIVELENGQVVEAIVGSIKFER